MTRMVTLSVGIACDDGVSAIEMSRHLRQILRDMPPEDLPTTSDSPKSPDLLSNGRVIHWQTTDVKLRVDRRPTAGGAEPGVRRRTSATGAEDAA